MSRKCVYSGLRPETIWAGWVSSKASVKSERYGPSVSLTDTGNLAAEQGIRILGRKRARCGSPLYLLGNETPAGVVVDGPAEEIGGSSRLKIGLPDARLSLGPNNPMFIFK